MEWQMIKSLTAASTVALLAMAGAASAQTSTTPGTAGQMKLSQAQCESIWNTLDNSKVGNVAEAQAKSHVRDFKSADANSDGKLSQAEFRSACDKGLVSSSATTGTATGTSGSTSTPGATSPPGGKSPGGSTK
jgi:hypothetical protein